MHNNTAEKPPGLKYRLKNIMAGQWSRELLGKYSPRYEPRIGVIRNSIKIELGG
jgi:hypothetical protein